ncbi:helix-turn-helix transcriptional regulator [Pleurocapsales cyanobacterium LEGE 06147]|nr:helix-turn-helix transcriptional regulator [Pleurocapsales cyanobacterium LEGE 06147]
MRQSLYEHNERLLQQLMQQAEISSIEELSKSAGVSELQLTRLRYGLLPKMQIETILKLAAALKVSVDRLIATFDSQLELPASVTAEENSAVLTSLKEEYRQLQQQLERQRESLDQEFQQTSLQVLESWLLQWPTAAAAVEKNPQLPAERLLPLVKPVEKLIQQWGLEAIGFVGEELPYDPQWHELMKGTAEAGDTVKIRYVGYKKGDQLLYRAKVSPIE